jgi:hypothetical protein
MPSQPRRRLRPMADTSDSRLPLLPDAKTKQTI